MKLKYLPVIPAVFLICSCSYENEEELFGVCDTSNVTFSQSVEPILIENCYQCHGIATEWDVIRLENFNVLKQAAEDGRLHGVINHLPGYPNMPYNRGKLAQCDIKIIDKWINDGAPNN